MTDQLPMPIPAPLTQAQQTTLLNLVRRAARAEIMPRFRKLDTGDVATKSGATDLVTKADTAAEAMIARGLQIAFPSALIVGEEATADDPDLRKKISDAEMCFLIDPVDGTWNFAHGVPVFGTIVAVCRFGHPVFGLIYDPIGDDVVLTDDATRSRRITKSGVTHPLISAREKPVSDLMGYMHLSLMPPSDRSLAALRSTQFGMVSSLRCSAYEYRLLAEGAVDFVLASQMTPWDHAAGVVLCKQAGGHAAMLDGTDYSAAFTEGYLLCAGSKATWTTVSEIFKDLLSSE